MIFYALILISSTGNKFHCYACATKTIDAAFSRDRAMKYATIISFFMNAKIIGLLFICKGDKLFEKSITKR